MGYNGWCMSCFRWRQIGGGKGQCGLLEIYTEEDFYCSSYFDENSLSSNIMKKE